MPLDSKQIHMLATKNIRWVLSLFFLSVCYLSAPVGEAANAPSQLDDETVQRIKNLPRDKQLELARRYGIDPGSIADSENLIGSDDNESEFTRDETLSPVKTIFVDESESIDDRNVLPRYGAHLFDKNVSTFAPIDNVPVPQGYLLGPGDTLKILLYGKEQSDFILTIDREGNISFPRLGAISLAGLRFPEAKQLIERRVTDQMIGTAVVVSMGQLRSINVFMAGDIRTPGSYSISALSTLTQALYLAGGTTKIGSHRDIQVRRQGELASQFDLYDLLLDGDPSGDIRMLSGDVIFVPVANVLVDIQGAVRRPGKYELLSGETLGDLISMAGGIDSHGFRRNARLTRYNNLSLPELHEINLTKKDQFELRLMDGDEIEIESISSRPSNAIRLSGAIARPGIYAWSADSRLSDLIQDPDADLLENTDLKAGLIVRRRNDRLDIDVIGFSPLEVIRNPKSELDPELNSFDEILFFSIPQSEDENFLGQNPWDVSNERSRTETNGDVESEDMLSNSSENLNSTNPEGEIESSSGDRIELLVPIVSRLKSQAGFLEEAAIVSIYGAVREPGEYPLLRNGTLQQLIDLAGGLSDGAYLESIEIRRIESIAGSQAQVEVFEVKLTGDELNEGKDFELNSRDVVRINNIPDWSPTDSIEIQGEVTFPGTFLITPGETLVSVLRRAGGLTQDAFAAGAHFTRLTILEAERQQLRALANSIVRSEATKQLTSEGGDSSFSALPQTPASNQGMLQTLLSIETEGRLVIDLESMIENGIDSQYDIELQSGDVLNVPQKTNAVTVVGEVNRPGSFTYQEFLSYEDYLSLAAGITDRSDRKRIYIVKANGRVVFPSSQSTAKWFEFASSEIEIQTGDTIVVPINQQFQLPLSRYREISTVVFQSIVSIASLLTLSN